MVGPVIGALIGLEIVRRRHQGVLTESRLAEKSQGSLLGFYRRQLDREIVVHRRAVAIAVVAAAAVVVTTSLGSHTTVKLAVAIALAIGMLCHGTWMALVKLPRLRRERAALN
jgi:hypothetical protein